MIPRLKSPVSCSCLYKSALFLSKLSIVSSLGFLLLSDSLSRYQIIKENTDYVNHSFIFNELKFESGAGQGDRGEMVRFSRGKSRI